MKASELTARDLRIGNYLNIIEPTDEYNGYIIVKGITETIPDDLIDFYSPKADFGYCGHQIELFEPIPLTEEWLLKFNFDEGEEGYYYIDKFIVSIDRHVYFGDSEEWIAEFQFVHQLQNLYWCLCGEELIIKE